MAARKTQPARPALDKRERFAHEYTIDLNATQAAIRAGYAKASAHVTGSRLLSDAKVQALIQVLNNERAAKIGITRERTLEHLAASAYFDPRRMFRPDCTLKPPAEWDDETAAGIASIETDETVLKPKGEPDESEADYVEKIITRKVKSWNKIQALSLCAEILGMKRTVNPAESGGLSITFIPSTAKR